MPLRSGAALVVIRIWKSPRKEAIAQLYNFMPCANYTLVGIEIGAGTLFCARAAGCIQHRLNDNSPKVVFICQTVDPSHIAIMAGIRRAGVGVLCRVPTRDADVEKFQRTPIGSAGLRGTGGTHITWITRRGCHGAVANGAGLSGCGHGVWWFGRSML